MRDQNLEDKTSDLKRLLEIYMKRQLDKNEVTKHVLAPRSLMGGALREAIVKRGTAENKPPETESPLSLE